MGHLGQVSDEAPKVAMAARRGIDEDVVEVDRQDRIGYSCIARNWIGNQVGAADSRSRHLVADGQYILAKHSQTRCQPLIGSSGVEPETAYKPLVTFLFTGKNKGIVVVGVKLVKNTVVGASAGLEDEIATRLEGQHRAVATNVSRYARDHGSPRGNDRKANTKQAFRTTRRRGRSDGVSLARTSSVGGSWDERSKKISRSWVC